MAVQMMEMAERTRGEARTPMVTLRRADRRHRIRKIRRTLHSKIRTVKIKIQKIKM